MHRHTTLCDLTIIRCDKKWELWSSSLRKFIQNSVTSCLTGPNNLFSTLFSKVLSPCSLVTVKDEQNFDNHTLELVSLTAVFLMLRHTNSYRQLCSLFRQMAKKFHVSYPAPKIIQKSIFVKKSRVICFRGYIMTSTNFDDYKWWYIQRYITWGSQCTCCNGTRRLKKKKSGVGGNGYVHVRVQSWQMYSPNGSRITTSLKMTLRNPVITAKF